MIVLLPGSERDPIEVIEYSSDEDYAFDDAEGAAEACEDQGEDNGGGLFDTHMTPWALTPFAEK